MKKSMLQQFSDKQMTRKEFLLISGLGIASIFGVGGLIRQLRSHAATPFVSTEPEKGTSTSPATIVTDTTASGGSAVKYGPAPTPAPTPTPVPPTGVIGATGGSGVQPTGVEANTAAPITRYQDLPVKGTVTGVGPNGMLSATVAGSLTKAVSFAPGSYTFYDFQDPTPANSIGVYFRTNITAIVGSGSKYTNFVLATNSQSAVAPTSGTNQLNKIRIGSAKVTLRGITFPDTTQKSLHNGVMMYLVQSGSLVEDVVIRGCPGNDGVPPGETFLINNWRGAGLTMQNVELDGRNLAGTTVGASLAGNNSSTGYSHFNNVYFRNAAFAHGSTEYLSQGDFTYNNCKFENIHNAGANFEQLGGVSGTGSITFNNCQWINCAHDILIDNTYRTSKCVIKEPVLASGQKVKILLHPNYSYGLPAIMPNLQSRADITLIYQGVVRNDLIQWL